MDSWRLKECIDLQRDMMAGRCGSRVYTIKETENKGGQLKSGWTICFSLKWHTTMLKLHRNGGRITWTELNWPVCVCVCVWVCAIILFFFITCRIISLVIASNTSNCLGLHSSFFVLLENCTCKQTEFQASQRLFTSPTDSTNLATIYWYPFPFIGSAAVVKLFATVYNSSDWHGESFTFQTFRTFTFS